MERPLVAGFLTEMKKYTLPFVSMKMFRTAVESGHVEVMQFLFDNGFPHIGNGATRAAVRGDKLVSLEWLADHIWMDYPEHFEYATEDAAQFGRLDMLEFLYNLDHSEKYEVVGKKRRLRSGRTFSWSTNLFFKAASGGQVAVLKWLQENRPDKSDFYAVDSAASKGYLDTVKWLHTNGYEGSVNAMLFAAHNGHFEVVKYLYENCPKTRLSCTAIEEAIFYGHFRIACWLRKKHPNHTVTEDSVVFDEMSISGNWQRDNVLEVLLFLRVFYPGVLTRGFLGTFEKTIPVQAVTTSNRTPPNSFWVGSMTIIPARQKFGVNAEPLLLQEAHTS